MEKGIVLKEKAGANFFGFETINKEGKTHPDLAVLRGNGTLKLTEDELIFSRWLPKKEFVIPIREIKKVEIKRVHNLKTKLLPILRVHYPHNEETRVFGVCIGFKKITKEWKVEIEKMMKND